MAKQLAADERSQEKLRRLRELTKTHQSKQLVSAVGTGDLQTIAESGTQEPVLEKIPGNSHDLLFERGWCALDIIDLFKFYENLISVTSKYIVAYL